MANVQPIYTKELLIDKFREIAAAGWIANARHGNAGGIGNTLEDLLGIEENNLPIPNAAEWEPKTQALHTTSLTTLFHVEPSPRQRALDAAHLAQRRCRFIRRKLFFGHRA
jgi:MvaI/BcnI restriction endonuclease family